MTDLKTLRSLIRMMVENDLTELDLQDEQEKITLKRGNGGAIQQVMPAQPVAAIPAPAAAPAATPAPAVADGGDSVAEPMGKTIDSPMVGRFFSAPNPDSPAYVSAGDSVSGETVVCLIEAMKVFNEIKAETSGKIKRVLVENGQAVEFGTPLFEIESA